MLRQLRAALRAGIVTEPVTAASELESVGHRLREEIHRRFGRSLHIRQVDAGSCNGCELEISGLTISSASGCTSWRPRGTPTACW